MVGLFGSEMAVHFSSKDMGLNARILGIVFGKSRLDCLGNSEMSYQTLDWPMCVVCVIAKFEKT